MSSLSNHQSFTCKCFPHSGAGDVGGKAEVCELHPAVLPQQDVVGLDVAVHNLVFVQVRDSRQYLVKFIVQYFRKLRFIT